MASDFSLLHGTSFLTSFSSRATKTLRHNMGGGNHPFSFVERREEEDPEVRSFLFFSLFSFSSSSTQKDIMFAHPNASLSAPAGKEDRIGNPRVIIDSRAFILSLSRMQYTDGAANARDDGRRDARIHGFRAVSVPPRVRPRLLLSPLRLGRGSVLLLSS